MNFGAMSPIGQNVGMGVGAGEAAGGQMSAADVLKLHASGAISLDPQQQLKLQQQAYQEASQDNARQQVMMTGVGAGLLNQTRNMDTQRAMALNSQANAAANVSNQLQQLGQARTNNANAINTALSAGLNIR